MGRGSAVPGAGFTRSQAFILEVILTLGLVSAVLDTTSAAQSLGALSAFGVSGNPGRRALGEPRQRGVDEPDTFRRPALAVGDLHDLWIYVGAPTVSVLLAFDVTWVQLGPGGGPRRIPRRLGKP